jgi:hypothetical protein
MKPFILKSMLIELIDPFKDVCGTLDEDSDETSEEKLEIGVVSGKFQISEEPIYGTWGIRVTTFDSDDDDDKHKTKVVTHQMFEIKEYVLPRFEVIVDTRRDVQQTENFIMVTISGNYTFGGFVKGKAVITARTYDSEYPKLVQHTTTKTVDVEYKKLVQFKIADELGVVNGIRPYFVKLNVELEETLTGQKITSKDVEVRIYKNGEYHLQIKPLKKRFKPGFAYEIETIVRNFDGKLATDRFNLVDLKVNYYYKPLLCSIKVETIGNFEHRQAKNLVKGSSVFKLEVPENTTAMAITATFLDATQTFNVTRQESNSREYLAVLLLAKRFVKFNS